ncbi:DNA ligase, partial [Thermococci archaeon]
MRYLELAQLYQKLEKTTMKLIKTRLVADFLKKVPDDHLEFIPYLILGDVFPEWDERELGVGEKLLIKAVAMAT